MACGGRAWGLARRGVGGCTGALGADTGPGSGAEGEGASWGRLAGLWPGGGPVRCRLSAVGCVLSYNDQRAPLQTTGTAQTAVDGQSQLRAVQLRAVQLNSCRNYESHGPRALGPCAPCAPAVPPTACMRPVRYVHTLKGYH